MSHLIFITQILAFVTVILINGTTASVVPCDGSPEYYDCEIPITDCTGSQSCDSDQCERFCAELGAIPVPNRCNEYFCFCKPCDSNCCWLAVRSALYERENCARDKLFVRTEETTTTTTEQSDTTDNETQVL